MNIRNFILMCFVLTAAISPANAKAPKKDNITVSGIIKARETTTLLLFVAQNGDWYEIARTDVDSAGNYKFEVNEPKGKIFAVASVVQRINPRPYKARFFAKSGDTVKLNVNSVWEKYDLGDNISEENRYFRKWVEMYDAIFPEINFETYDTMLPKSDDFITSANKYADEIKLKDKKTKKLMQFYIKNDALFGLLNFYFIPNIRPPKKEQMPSFFDDFAKHYTFEQSMYQEIPITSQMITYMISYYNTLKDNNDTYKQIEEKVLFSIINNDAARAVYFIYKIGAIRVFEDFSRLYGRLNQYSYSKRQQSVIDKYISENKHLAKGQPAFDFKFSDINGNTVSLSDFKGKVVVIDMWATWCGPCLLQIPHMQKLEEELANNSDVVIISVSLDSENDKEKWKKMVKEKNMGGIQLIRSADNTVFNWYNVKSIPHFMVIDKKGNIVSAYAPRPSEPQLKEMIMNEL